MSFEENSVEKNLSGRKRRKTTFLVHEFYDQVVGVCDFVETVKKELLNRKLYYEIDKLQINDITKCVSRILKVSRSTVLRARKFKTQVCSEDKENNCNTPLKVNDTHDQVQINKSTEIQCDEFTISVLRRTVQGCCKLN